MSEFLNRKYSGYHVFENKAVAKIIKKIESNFSGSSVKGENEYARIYKMIDVASQYSRKVENQQKQERKTLVLKLMLGVALTSGEIDEIKTLFKSDTFVTVAFCAPEYVDKLFPGENIRADEKGEAINLIITNIFTELMGPYGSVDIVNLNNVTFLFSPQEKYIENVVDVVCSQIENMRNTISQHFGVDIVCGISSPVKGAADICISYREALSIGYKIDAEKLMACAKTTSRRVIDKVFEDYVSDICEFASGGSAGRETTMIDKINEIISENYTNTDFNVNMIADILGVNANSLSVIYKRKTDNNILENIQSLRVKEAKRLLEDCDDTLEDIAQRSGFGSNTTFRRVFKKSTGVSPVIYREMKRKEQE